MPEKQGSVYNNYSNIVVVIAIDGSAIAEWQGYDHPGYEELTNRLFDGDDVTVELAGKAGALFDMGGCGSSKVFRLADDDVAMIEHYSADWNPAIEAQFLEVVRAGIGEDAHPIGTVEITSGVLALLHAGDPGAGDVPAPAIGTATKHECHVLLGVPNGRYAVLGERLEAKGGWGTIETRVRIVREESLGRAKAPAAARATSDWTSIARPESRRPATVARSSSRTRRAPSSRAICPAAWRCGISARIASRTLPAPSTSTSSRCRTYRSTSLSSGRSTRTRTTCPCS